MLKISTNITAHFCWLFLLAPVGFSRSLVITGEDYDAVSIFVFTYIPVEDLEIEFTTHSGNATEGK